MKTIKILLTIFMVTTFVQTGKSASYYYTTTLVPNYKQEHPAWCFFTSMQMLYTPHLSQCHLASEYGGLYSDGCCDRWNPLYPLPYACEKGVLTTEATSFLQRYVIKYPGGLLFSFPDDDYYGSTYKLPCIVVDEMIGHAYVATEINVSQVGYTVTGNDPWPGYAYAYYTYNYSNQIYSTYTFV
ncbi:MAG: hypothetical protein LBU91_02490 [Bacteroidales bacterium]|jgi:hypothetical protein|nr:hypothetical protein [Bacteroidales bacterium]